METVERLKFVKHLQSLGLTLNEIAGMLDAVTDNDSDCSRERPRVEAALPRIDEKLATLKAVRKRLQRALARCDAGTCELVDRGRRVIPRRVRVGQT